MKAVDQNHDIARLKSDELALAGEVDQLRHELRRVKDSLERVGGQNRELELKARQLSSNIRLCRQALESNQKRQQVS